MTKMRLFGEPGWGSAIVEAQLDWYGFVYDFERVGDLFKSAESRQRLVGLNPLAQIPTLVFPNGAVMTETAAITLYLADLTEQDSLVPNGKAPQRSAFLRWLVFLVANVYPTYTYADDPSRFVDAEEVQGAFKARVFAYREKLYAQLEQTASSPWFLGERFSALDIYVCAMSRWRPGRPWFATNAPRLAAISARTEQVPQLTAVWRRNGLGN